MLKEDRKSIDVTEKLAKDRRQKKRPSGKNSIYYISIVRLSDIFLQYIFTTETVAK